MHPTTHAAVGSGGGGVGNGDSGIDGEQRTLSGIKLMPQHLKNGSGGQHQSLANGHQNGHAQNGTTAAALTATTATTTTPLYNNSNGNGNGVGVGVGSGINGSALNGFHQNGGRRDSAQMWTPLLANGNGNVNNVNSNDAGIGDGNEDTVMPTTMLYASNTPSNNNEWKDAEEINNLKNGLLHHAKHHNHNHHNHNHNHNHHHHNHNNHHQQGNNNNGSLLLNGKNGLALTATDKYDPEQDPLTGLYKQKKHTRSSESDESDFDSDLTGGGSSGAGTGLSGGERGGKTVHGCGLFGCRPRWARRFASTKCFMVVFLLAYILQGMYMTYFVSVITTIEKLFQIKSKTTGFLLSASEMGQISTAMLLTYFAGRGHRPRWIACGMVLFSIAAFSCSLPHFIFGDQLIQSAELLKPSSNDGFTTNTQMLHSSYGQDPATALPNDTTESTALAHYANLCQLGNNPANNTPECNEDRRKEQVSHSKITVIVLCIFFASLLSSGIGQTAVATLGIPYIDDNVASKQSPMYMAITIGVRILGPASGFIVGSFCTRWYVNFSNPGFNASDPRWIGAWWLGPVAIGTLMMLASIAMFSFPSQLRGKSKPATATPPNGSDANGDGVNATALAAAEEKPKLKDFPKTVRRQLSNDILMFRTASCVFHLLPIAGLYTFLPKYLETQFRLATYDANMVAAFCGILVMGVGIVISGLVILKLKPSARSVSAWIAFTALFYSVGMFILMFIGCSMTDFAGFQPATNNTPALIGQSCSIVDNCTCDKENFAPICGTDGLIYISSCHAGCTSAELNKNDNSTLYSNCKCITDGDVSKPYQATSGYCESTCKNFIIFILIFAVCVFMHSTSEVGSMLLVMRCTHPKDKAMAMGVIQSAIGLFGNVPCPIIYGAVVDSACLIWKTVCSKHGACSLYNADTFRHYFLGITSGIMFLAFIMDIVVWSKAHRIDIALEDGNEHVANDEEGKSPTAECKKSMTDATDTSV